MKLKELKNTVVNTKTQAEYDELMKIYEEAGWRRSGGNKATEFNYWSAYKENTCIEANDSMSYSDKKFYKNEGYRLLTLEEFKKEQGTMKYKVGDILKSSSGSYPYIKVLGVCGEAYLISSDGDCPESADLKRGGEACTEFDLDEIGYSLYAPKPETIEIDGKRYSKSEVSEWLKELKEIEG